MAVVGAQLNFFSSDAAAAPDGLRYQPDFISAAEERDLIERILALPLAPFQFGAFEGKRQVASFGWRYDYAQQKLEMAEDLPAWLEPFVARIAAFGELPASSIRQVLFGAGGEDERRRGGPLHQLQKHNKGQFARSDSRTLTI